MCSSTTAIHERTSRKVARIRRMVCYIEDISSSIRKNIEHEQLSFHRTRHGKNAMAQKHSDPVG